MKTLRTFGTLLLALCLTEKVTPPLHAAASRDPENSKNNDDLLERGIGFADSVHLATIKVNAVEDKLRTRASYTEVLKNLGFTMYKQPDGNIRGRITFTVDDSDPCTTLENAVGSFRRGNYHRCLCTSGYYGDSCNVLMVGLKSVTPNNVTLSLPGTVDAVDFVILRVFDGIGTETELTKTESSDQPKHVTLKVEPGKRYLFQVKVVQREQEGVADVSETEEKGKERVSLGEILTSEGGTARAQKEAGGSDSKDETDEENSENDRENNRRSRVIEVKVPDVLNLPFPALLGMTYIVDIEKYDDFSKSMVGVDEKNLSELEFPYILQNTTFPDDTIYQVRLNAVHSSGAQSTLSISSYDFSEGGENKMPFIPTWPKKQVIQPTCLCLGYSSVSVTLPKLTSDEQATCGDIRVEWCQNGSTIWTAMETAASTKQIHLNQSLADGLYKLRLGCTIPQGQHVYTTPLVFLVKTSVSRCRENLPQPPENGSVDLLVLEGNQIAQFSCNNGFILNGAKNHTCSTEGWSGLKPSCNSPTGQPGGQTQNSPTVITL